jgi:hypothetical protein
MTRMIRRRCSTPVVTALWALAAACATTEPPKAPEQSTDIIELFRRARFKELSELDQGSSIRWVARLRAKQLSEGEEMADWQARVAYRRGDAAAANDQLQSMSPANRTRKIIAALLENVDVRRPLRETIARPSGVRELPLNVEALHLGLPVVEIEIEGRHFKMLWDTGASENVLSPKAVDELELLRAEVQFPVLRDIDGYVVRFAATGTKKVLLGPWVVANVPWLVADLTTVADLLQRATTGLDGFLSPQLLLPQGCFVIDKMKSVLRLGFDVTHCKALQAGIRERTPIFTWNGEVYASARIHNSPEVAIQLETGSPVSFLRSDASRYLPRGLIATQDREEAIATDLTKTVVLAVAGHSKPVSSIDLEPRRATEGHDDLATLGTDILFAGQSMVLNFLSMELGFVDPPGKVATGP